MNKEQATNISPYQLVPRQQQDWIGLSSVLRPCQHSIGYMGDGFYRSKDPTNSIKVLKYIYTVRHKKIAPFLLVQ